MSTRLGEGQKDYQNWAYAFDEEIFICVSRLNRMYPPSDSKNLSQFKTLYGEHKTYFLAPGVVSGDWKRLKSIFELGIFKGKIHFRHVLEISSNAIDSVFMRADPDDGA